MRTPRMWASVWAGVWVGVGGLAASLPAAATTFEFGDLPLTVPAGFVIEQVAAPPLVERPVTCAFDEQGRLYVSESSGSNAPLVEQQKDPKHRVLRLEDTDGDGVFDRRTVFAEGLMMLQGTLWHAGSLYVAAAPEILKLTDTDDDGVADLREVWHDGGTLTGCGNDLHGPYRAPDGRIEFTKGAFAEQTHDLVGQPGWSTRAGHVFRCRDDHTDFEAVMTGGMDNPVDVAFTATGDRLLSATFLTHPAGGQRDGVVHAVYGGMFGKEHGVLAGHPRTGDLLPALIHLGPAAACGLHVHSGFRFGTDAVTAVFACSFNLRQVTRHILSPQGATFAVQSESFLSGDSADFHPTDVVEDADGSLLVVDTGGWYKLCCPTSQMEKPSVPGAIYRVRPVDTPPCPDPRGLALNWSTPTAAELAARLGDQRPAVAERAVEALAARQAVTEVADVLAEVEAEEAARLRAVWCLARIDTAEAREAVRQALADDAAAVRQAACHVAGLLRDREATGGLVAALRAEVPSVQRVAAEALGRLGGGIASAALVDAARSAHDRFLEHALTFALLESGETGPLVAALTDASPHLRRLALIALSQPGRSGPPTAAVLEQLEEAVIAAVAAEHAALRDTGLWLLADQPEWAGACVPLLPDLLDDVATAEGAERSRRVQRLARLLTNPQLADGLAAHMATSREQERTRVAVEVMQQSRLPAVPERWLSALEAFLARTGDEPGLREQVVDTLATLPLSAGQRQQLRPRLLAVADMPAASLRLRLRAVEAAGAAGHPPPAVVARVLAAIAASDGVSPLDRTAAIDLLAEAELSRDDQRRLACLLAALPASDVARLLPMLTTAGGDVLSAALQTLAKHPRPEAWPRPLVTAAVAAAVEAGDEPPALLEAIDAAAGAQRGRYERLVASLPPGDAARGHRVFLSAKAACTTCHAMAYAGGRIGPDLTRIGSIRTTEDLLEAILLPSQSFVRSYEPVTVLTTGGNVIAGIPLEQDEQQVVLQTSATEQVSVPREQIEELQRGEVSLMPAGYEMLLSPQEIADVVAFLARAR